MMMRPRKMKKLMPCNQKTFFQTVMVGETCRYSFSYYMYREVKTIAERNNVVIDYHRPGSHEYKTYGDNCFCIISTPSSRLEDLKPILFDPVKLMI